MTFSTEEILILFVLIFEMILFSLWLFDLKAISIFKNVPPTSDAANIYAANLELELLAETNLV